MDTLQKLDIKLLEGTSLFGRLFLLKPFQDFLHIFGVFYLDLFCFNELFDRLLLIF